jgi:hypothetical protein
MKGVFEFLINGELKTFYDYREIPEDFDHVIKFIPEIPDGPHSHEQHEEMDQWNYRLQELVAKERIKHGH